jgi:16S rRNA (uracil1498-N3)-methyltransferase
VERWRRIAREASEQARRVAPPEIAEPVKLSAALEPAADLRIVLTETEREVQLTEMLQARPESQSLALAIGPEGGWTPDELQTFEQAGWAGASLGGTILRAETAAIASLAIARAEIG